MRRPGVGQNRRIGFHGIGGGGAAGPTYSPAESAVQLPNTAIWISQQGVTQAGTVSSWVSYLGGVACTVTQGTGAAQPAYNASGGVGGRPLITFDGVGDGLSGTMTKGSAWADYEVGMVGHRVAYVASNATWVGYGPAGTVRFSLNDSSVVAVRLTVTGGANVLSTTDPDGVDAHYSGDAITGSLNMRVNGVIEATSAGTATSRADGDLVTMGAQSSLANPANIAAQACYAGPLLSAAQRTYLRGLLTFYTGINS